MATKPPEITIDRRPGGYFAVQVDGYTKFVTRDYTSAQIVAESYMPKPPRTDEPLQRRFG